MSYVKDQILDVILDELMIDHLPDLNTPLKEIPEYDSLSSISLIFALEEHFNKSIWVKEKKNLTLGQLCSNIELQLKIEDCHAPS